MPAYIIGAAGLLAVLGAFLPWVTLSAPIVGTISKNAIDGDGVIALGLGVALLVYAVLRVAGFRLHVIVAAVLAFALPGLAVYEVVHVYLAVADMRASMASDPSDEYGIGAAMAKAISVDPGIGLWLEVLTGLAALGGVWLTIVVARRTPVATAHRPYPVLAYPQQGYPVQGYPQQGHPHQELPASELPGIGRPAAAVRHALRSSPGHPKPGAVAQPPAASWSSHPQD